MAKQHMCADLDTSEIKLHFWLRWLAIGGIFWAPHLLF
jgi:hypothetical protein